MSYRVLVTIANHGSKNRVHCQHLIDTYLSMPYDVDVVVLSDVAKDYGPSVEVQVGAPTDDPWSLPFAHRRLFIERQDRYDLFIYSEDDTEVRERHVELFLEASELLPADRILGFLRYEFGDDGEAYYSTAHHVYHWDPDSLIEANSRLYARYTNDHAGCYILNRQQLKTCIESGGFTVDPHKTHFDMLVSAATDPYTRCGLTRLVCISELFDYSLHHLPNAYVNRIGVTRSDVEAQVTALEEQYRSGQPPQRLFQPTTAIKNQDSTWDKSYYEPLNHEIIDLVSSSARSMLSIGCDRGATERKLLEAGIDVAAIPIDSIIAACPARYGITTTSADLQSGLDELSGRRFDAILFNRSLAYFADPADVLDEVVPLLSSEGRIIVVYDNREDVAYLRTFRRVHRKRVRAGGFEEAGVHWTDRSVVHRWLSDAGLIVGRTTYQPPERRRRLAARTGGRMDRWIGATAITTAVGQVTGELSV